MFNGSIRGLLLVYDNVQNIEKTYSRATYPFRLAAEFSVSAAGFLEISLNNHIRRIVVVAKTQKAIEKFIQLNGVIGDGKLKFLLFTGPTNEVIKKIEK